MKKLLLSVLVIVSFILYSLFQRKDDLVGSANLAPQGNTNNTISISPSTTPQTSPSPTTISTTPDIKNTPKPTPTATPTPTKASLYKNGTYIGDVTDAYYGNVQVQVQVSGGNISSVNFLQYPSDRSRSISINSYAMPILEQEAIKAQSANVDTVSGATDTSLAFISSMQSALAKAQN